MSSDPLAGRLVQSDQFTGTAKIVDVDRDSKLITLGFFESPKRLYSRSMQLPSSSLRGARLAEGSNLYCIDQASGILRRGQYGGPRPDKKHAILVEGEKGVVEATEQEIFIPVLENNAYHDVQDLVECRVFDGGVESTGNSSKEHAFRRSTFIETYLKQKDIADGFPGFLSSSVELESHQIAVVKRIQADSVRRYLLADEVGLGKTIEAGLLIANHLHERTGDVRVLVSVPANLVQQWEEELEKRFYIDNTSLPEGSLLEVIPHEELKSYKDLDLTMLVVDEAHQIVPSSIDRIDPRYDSHQILCSGAEEVLLLTGTPVGGNELQYLGLLSLLSPADFTFDSAGLEKFDYRLSIQGKVGAIYASLKTESSDAVIGSNLERLRAIADGSELSDLVDRALVLYDPFEVEDIPARHEVLSQIRTEIEQEYKLFHRMIRNRRDVADIAALFPGLKGAIVESYSVDGDSLEDIALDYFDKISASNIDDSEWLSPLLDSYFAGPGVFRLFLHSQQSYLGRFDSSQVDQIVADSLAARFEVIKRVAEEWLRDAASGLVLIFTDDEDERRELLTNLAGSLTLNVTEISDVEHYTRSEISQKNVFVGGRAMEDGFNFHGPDRLVIHASLPRSLQRFEQRMGRVNRYSANLKGIQPIPSVVIAPDTVGFYRGWADLLSDHIGVFDRTLASIINPLEKSLKEMWAEVAKDGFDALDRWGDKELSGDSGVIEREFREVRGQEALLVMENEIIDAEAFSSALADYEEVDGSSDSEKYNAWITKTLNLKKAREGQGSAFRYAYKRARGNRDQDSFVDPLEFRRICYSGLDMSGDLEDSTFPMAMSRAFVSSNPGVMPCRFGTPFIDAIYDLLLRDPRGVTSGQLLIDPGQGASAQDYNVSFEFRIQWVTALDSLSRGSSKSLGGVEVTWVDQDGNVTQAAKQTDARREYQVLDLIPKTWQAIHSGEIISEQDWASLVVQSFEKARTHLHQSDFGSSRDSLLPIACYVKITVDQ